MNKLANKRLRELSPPAKNLGTIITLGVGDFAKGLQFTQFKRFSINLDGMTITSMDHLAPEKELEAMRPPVIVILGLVRDVSSVLFTIRRVWPYASIMIAADESRLADVYPLLVSGASDFLPLMASTSEIESRCLIQAGVHQARMHDSSRTFGRLTVNFAQRTVTNGKEITSLTPIELNIVRTLVDHYGGVVDRDKMKQICWGDAEISDNALNRKIYEVRRTLRRLSESINIRTIYGKGFELKVR